MLAHACLDLATYLSASGASKGEWTVFPKSQKYSTVKLGNAAQRACDAAIGHVISCASDDLIAYIGEAISREKSLFLQAASAQAHAIA